MIYMYICSYFPYNKNAQKREKAGLGHEAVSQRNPRYETDKRPL